MKRVLLGSTLGLLTVSAQAQTFYAPGTPVSRLDTATVEGVFYKLGRKASAPGTTDSFTIKEISLRRFEGGDAIYIQNKKGYYFPVNDVARDAVSQSGNNSADTITTSTGYKIGIGQRVRLGGGSGADGDFRYVRINSASAFRYYSTNGDRRAANSANSASANNAGMELKVVRVERRSNGGDGTVDYAIVNSSDGLGMLRFEIDVERAIKSGELEVGDQYRIQPASSGTTIIQTPLSPADELLKFKKLLDAGAITQEEYDEQKKKLLAR